MGVPLSELVIPLFIPARIAALGRLQPEVGPYS
jgi:hypothetical protein